MTLKLDAFVRLAWVAVSLGSVLAFSARVHAQAPTLSVLNPSGGQRGGTVDVTVSGANLVGAHAIWTNLPATASIPADLPNNGKDAGRVVVRLQIPADAPVGIGGLRIATAQGISNLRLFAIDDIPSAAEKEPNNTRDQAQTIAPNSVATGTMEAENWDFYKFTAAAGQKLSIEVVARRLGSALDPQIRLLDATGRDLAYADDTEGLGQDCRLYYTFDRAGDYTIELRDVRFQGGEAAFYRLRLGEFPAAALPLPMAGKRGSKALVTPKGPGTEQSPPIEVAVSTESAVAEVPVQAKSVHSGRVVPLALRADVLDELVEREPNDEPAAATRFQVPQGVNGCFDKPGDADRYVFSAKKDQRILFETTSRRAGSPADLFLVIQNAQGQELAAVDDSDKDDARIDFKVPADGDYQLVAWDLSRRGGADYVYRVRVTPFEPGFRLLARQLDQNKTAIDKMDVPRGAAALLLVRPVRIEYGGPIALSIDGLGAGLTASPTTIGTGQADTIMTVHATEGASLGAARVRVVGTAEINGQKRTAYADVSEALSAALNNLPFPPANLNHELALCVAEKPFFTLEVKPDGPALGRATALTIAVSAKRAADFKDPITLALQGVPANVDVAAPAIDKEKNEAKITLTAKNNAVLGVHSIAVTGTGKLGNAQITVAAPAINLDLRMPFELALDPAGGKVAQNNKLKLKAKVTRLAGFKAPIALELKNLPKGVTAPKVTIPEGGNEVEIELAAAADATVGPAATVNLAGTAGDNLSATSTNVTLEVVVK
jgi:hypothetical protein